MCECKVCTTSREFNRIIEQLPIADRNWTEEFYDMHCNEMLDANVNQAIIDGMWPTADEVIAGRRELLKQRKENGST